jgi:hypothetical protein
MSEPCECCQGNGYQCDGCGAEGEPLPHGYEHENGYVWDAVRHFQMDIEPSYEQLELFS